MQETKCIFIKIDLCAIALPNPLPKSRLLQRGDFLDGRNLKPGF